MSAQVGAAYFDTCTLSNFDVVKRLALLETRYGYRARWTETIRYEVKRGLPSNPHLQSVLDAAWLGEPIEIEASTAALAKIDNIRRGLGGRLDNP